MIYYFSGTGNTWLAANRLQAELGSDMDLITEISPEGVTISDRDLVFMFPVYAWGVPPIMMEFIEKIPESEIEKIRSGMIRAWAVATCGDETGMAVEMFRVGLRKRGVELCGVWSVITPNVYVLLPGFDVDSREVEEEKLEKMKPRIKEIANIIKGHKEGAPAIEDVHHGPLPKLKTRLVYPLFKRWGINTAKWKWSRECIGCGKCAEVCPEKNIVIQGGHPRWGGNCDSCLACYHICPTHAVEYGKITVGKGQYKRGLRNKSLS